MLYDINDKKFTLLPGGQLNGYSKPAEKFFYYNISNFRLFKSGAGGEPVYLFTNRLERLAGLTSFTKYGTLQLLNTIKFDSYPSNINVARMEGGRKRHAVISGHNFNGLSILSENNLVLSERKILTDRIFQSIVIEDFNDDGLNDIVGIDVLKNSLVFFYNYDSLNFIEERLYAVEEKISNLKSVDFNKNRFHDLIFNTQNHIVIFLGDSVYSFKRKFHIKTAYPASDFTVGDFDGNGFNDIAYFNKEAGVVYLHFQQSYGEFSPPLVYLKNKKISGLSAVRDKNSHRLIVSDSGGFIYFLERISEADKAFEIALGVRPGAVNYLKSGQREYIYFIDEETAELKILSGTKRNFGQVLHSFKLMDNHSKITARVTGREMLDFYCYSPGENAFEILTADLRNNTALRKKVYTEGNIIELKFNEQKFGGVQTVSALTRQGSLFLSSTFSTDEGKIRKISGDSLSNALACIYSPYKPGEVFYWREINEELVLERLSFADKSAGEVIRIPRLMPQNGNINMSFESIVDIEDGQHVVISCLQDGSEIKVFTIKNENFSALEFNNNPIAASLSSGRYFPVLNSYLKQLEFDKHFDTAGNYKLILNLFESNKINDYFFAKFLSDKIYFVYTLHNSNSITFLEIE